MDSAAKNAARGEDPNRDYPEPALSEAGIEQLKKSLSQRVIGQEKVMSDILASFPKNSTRRPIILMGSPGTGKTEAIKLLAEELSKERKSSTRSKGIIIIDEPLRKTPEELDEIFAAISGKPTRTQIAEEAASEFHTGTTQAITPMKRIRLKTGFISLC